MENTTSLLARIRQGDHQSLARVITIVENELEGFQEILYGLHHQRQVQVIGFTGPPGSGKSTLINAFIRKLSAEGKKVAVVAVDPTSPFNYGSLLGDRLRMVEHFTDPNIFIRSLATRGSLGGLSEKIIEIMDVLKEADFDMIIVETVGVGQSEVEIAGLADTTVVVLVPESGDEVQTLKSGIMEIADLFVVNKSDREGADTLANSLSHLIHEKKGTSWIVPVLKCSATQQIGLDELMNKILEHQHSGAVNDKRNFLMTEKAYRLMQQKRMKPIRKTDLKNAITEAAGKPGFNLYRFTEEYNP